MSFETEFLSDEEIDQAFKEIGAIIEAQESKTAILNPVRMRQLAIAYRTAKSMLQDTDATVTYTLHEPYKSVGCISIVGEIIIIDKPTLLGEVSKHASNVEIISRTDGVAQIDFTFLGLTTPIE